MNIARLIEWRGRAALWLAELLSRMADQLTAQATRDVARAMKPELAELS